MNERTLWLSWHNDAGKIFLISRQEKGPVNNVRFTLRRKRMKFHFYGLKDVAMMLTIKIMICVDIGNSMIAQLVKLSCIL